MGGVFSIWIFLCLWFGLAVAQEPSAEPAIRTCKCVTLKGSSPLCCKDKITSATIVVPPPEPSMVAQVPSPPIERPPDEVDTSASKAIAAPKRMASGPRTLAPWDPDPDPRYALVIAPRQDPSTSTDSSFFTTTNTLILAGAIACLFAGIASIAVYARRRRNHAPKAPTETATGRRTQEPAHPAPHTAVCP